MWWRVLGGPLSGRMFVGVEEDGRVELVVGRDRVWAPLASVEPCESPAPPGFRKVLWAAVRAGDQVWLPAENGYGLVPVGPYSVAGPHALWSRSSPFFTDFKFEYVEEDLCIPTG
jgi:hypothetical protein